MRTSLTHRRHRTIDGNNIDRSGGQQLEIETQEINTFIAVNENLKHSHTQKHIHAHTRTHTHTHTNLIDFDDIHIHVGTHSRAGTSG